MGASNFFGLSQCCVFAFRPGSVLKGCNRDWRGSAWMGSGAVSEGLRTASFAHPGASSRKHHDGRDTGFRFLPSGCGGVFGCDTPCSTTALAARQCPIMRTARSKRRSTTPSRTRSDMDRVCRMLGISLSRTRYDSIEVAGSN